VVVTGQFLFFTADQTPRRGTLESVFTLQDGLWQHIASNVQEGPVEAIPLTVRVRTAESSLPLDDVEVLARRQGSQILTSGSIRTDSNGEARLVVLRGVFDLQALTEGFDPILTADIHVDQPAIQEISITGGPFNRPGKLVP
jgi:hypothetical protein